MDYSEIEHYDDALSKTFAAEILLVSGNEDYSMFFSKCAESLSKFFHPIGCMLSPKTPIEEMYEILTRKCHDY